MRCMDPHLLTQKHRLRSNAGCPQLRDDAHAYCWAGCRLKEVDHGELELDLNWYSVLDQQPAQ